MKHTISIKHQSGLPGKTRSLYNVLLDGKIVKRSVSLSRALDEGERLFRMYSAPMLRRHRTGKAARRRRGRS